MGISALEIVDRYPRLYHMAELGSWDSIRQHGLLSTSALLDLYQVKGDARFVLESQHRPKSVDITMEGLGTAVVRDQKPMSDKALKLALRDGLTPRDWYETLNEKVFFWLEEQRLNTLLGARAYRNRRHTVMTVDTKHLLEKHCKNVVLAPINSGATVFKPQPRGRDTFLPLDQYPFDEWNAKRRGNQPIVELAVRHSVPDIADFIIRVDNRGRGEPDEPVWSC